MVRSIPELESDEAVPALPGTATRAASAATSSPSTRTRTRTCTSSSSISPAATPSSAVSGIAALVAEDGDTDTITMAVGDEGERDDESTVRGELGHDQEDQGERASTCFDAMSVATGSAQLNTSDVFSTSGISFSSRESTYSDRYGVCAVVVLAALLGGGCLFVRVCAETQCMSGTSAGRGR